VRSPKPLNPLLLSSSAKPQTPKPSAEGFADKLAVPAITTETIYYSDPQPSTLNPQPSTLNPQFSILSSQPDSIWEIVKQLLLAKAADPKP